MHLEKYKEVLGQEAGLKNCLENTERNNQVVSMGRKKKTWRVAM